MSELLGATLRMMMASTGASRDQAGARPLVAIPATVPYADYVRRFEPAAASIPASPHTSAMSHLLRVSRALETLNGFALGHAARVGAHDSDHLYRAHGDPRD